MQQPVFAAPYPAPPPPAFYSPHTLAEEDLQLSLALAQSTAAQAREQAEANLSQSAEKLSEKYWKEHCLDFNDPVPDGFYDVYGHFPEVVEDPLVEFPKLRDLSTGVRLFDDSDVREVILVDHINDPALVNFEYTAWDAASAVQADDTVGRIKVLALAVARQYGGPYASEDALDPFWLRASAEERRKTRSVVVLLGRLSVGSTRHRALLFKVLADASRIPCKLICGRQLCGTDSRAMNVVVVGGQQLYVDLVQQPGRLLSCAEFQAVCTSKSQGPSANPSTQASLSLHELEVDLADLSKGRWIGNGSYGDVYWGMWRGTEVAIKQFKVLEEDMSANTIKEFKKEVMIMYKLRHPNILLLMGAVMQPNQLAIVTQFMPRGSLYRLLHGNPKVELDGRRRLKMAKDVAKGMENLHNCRPAIVHRDLKSANLLVDKDWTVKVCDFGLSKVMGCTTRTARTSGGTYEWMAPEVLRGEAYDEKSDVYSYGVILYELVTGIKPWNGLLPAQVVGLVGFRNQHLELPADLEAPVVELIKACWAQLPQERPSFSHILKALNQMVQLQPSASAAAEAAAAAAAASRS